MKKFFKLHDYNENMKAMIAIFSLKGKTNIWWEDVKRVKGIKTKELSLHEFKRFFRKKYLSEIYYDDKAKEFYELNMGSITNEVYKTKFLELLWCVPYFKDEKKKVQRFAIGFPLAFKDQIDYDEPWTLEDVIGKLNIVMSNPRVS